MNLKIGDRVYVHGHIDEIRKDTVIIRNDGGYFGTIPSEIVKGEFVTCRNCKHRPTIKDGFIVLTEETKKCPFDGGDYIHSWIPGDNFYCANAERRG